ncbi:MAG: glutamyl-tRNA reductase [Deltaproteobacteria bacterium]|nr:glutamyl-tRNA reductase [Deltaproteobacteria bacterium]
MDIGLIGLNHKTAPVELREQLSAACTQAGPVVDVLKALPAVQEALFITTCNRVEILFTAPSLEAAFAAFLETWSRDLQRAPEELQRSIYTYRADEAIRHLFRVAASLDSLVVGEPQILGQIKEAYREASKSHATGIILNRLLHRAFSTAKRIRTETGIAGHAVSISFAAVELAKKIFQELAGKKVLLIGAGEMAELAAEHLWNNKVAEIVVANRTLERAQELAHRWRGRALSLEEVPVALIQTDIVISSTGAPDILIQQSQVRAIMKQRRQRPLFFIDIAVPRDIDPRVNDVDNVYLYDIDDLQGVVSQNMAARKNEALEAERIVEEEAIKFRAWLNGLEVVPTIVALRQKMEEIRLGELKRGASALQELTPEQLKAVELISQSMVNKIIHDPITFLKRSGNPQQVSEQVDLAQKFFNLNTNGQSG